MSLQSLLQKIWAGIEAFWANAEPELKVAVGVGVLLVQNVKNFIASPAADVLTAIIPGNVDDNIKTLLRGALPKILNDMLLFQSTLGLTDPNEIAAEALKVLAALDPKVSAAFMHNLSIMVAQVAADGKLTWSDGVYILQYYYKNEFQQAA